MGPPVNFDKCHSDKGGFDGGISMSTILDKTGAMMARQGVPYWLKRMRRWISMSTILDKAGEMMACP